MEIIERRENQFPDDLEGRLNAVLNVVNTEFKSATLLHLDDSPAEADEIRARIRETVGNGVYLTQAKTFRGYCHKTFLPIGTVAEELIRRESVEAVYPAWRLTEAGRRYGRPIACLALEYAVDNGISLYAVLGPTHSRGKKRAPLNRVRILKALSENESLTETDLARKSEMACNGILVALEKLKQVGFVEFDSIGELRKGKSVIIYSWIDGKAPEDAKPVYAFPALTKKIAELGKEKRRLTYEKVCELLGGPFARQMITSVLSGLAKQGFMEREKGFTGGVKQSEVRITDKAGSFMDFVYRAEEILSGKLSEREMQEIYFSFINREDYRESLRKAFEMYKEVSPQTNKKPREETNEMIIRFLRNNNGARGCELRKALKLKFGCTGSYLTPLVKAKILRKVKDGRETRYYVAN